MGRDEAESPQKGTVSASKERSCCALDGESEVVQKRESAMLKGVKKQKCRDDGGRRFVEGVRRMHALGPDEDEALTTP